MNQAKVRRAILFDICSEREINKDEIDNDSFGNVSGSLAPLYFVYFVVQTINS
jgi:hypothetical protein